MITENVKHQFDKEKALARIAGVRKELERSMENATDRLLELERALDGNGDQAPAETAGEEGPAVKAIDRLECKELVITDDEGRERIKLHLERPERVKRQIPYITVFDECGKEAFSASDGILTIDGFAIVDDKGRIRAAFSSFYGSELPDGTLENGQAQLDFYDENEESIFCLGENKAGVIQETRLDEWTLGRLKDK